MNDDEVAPEVIQLATEYLAKYSVDMSQYEFSHGHSDNGKANGTGYDYVSFAHKTRKVRINLQIVSYQYTKRVPYEVHDVQFV